MLLPFVRNSVLLLLVFLIVIPFFLLDDVRKMLQRNRVGLTFTAVLPLNRTSLPSLPESSLNVNNPSVENAWCVLDSGNLHKQFRHFPHTLQNLAPCWSYFCKQQRQQNHNVSCGLFFNVSDQEHFNYKDIDIWARHLVRSMHCKVMISDASNITAPSQDDAFFRARSMPWFDSPQDVELLQQLVLARRKTKDSPPTFTVSDRLQIGIIQRYPRNKKCEKVPMPKPCSHYREISNLDQVEKSLQAAFPSADIQVTKLKGKDLAEQAWWWYNQDIVVAAHGATLANVIFLRPRSAVVEIFPTDYAPGMFQSLMNNIGVFPYRIDRASSKQFQPKNEHPRNVALEPNITLVVELVQKAVLQREQAKATTS
jgi:hypothetical protein